MLEKVVLTMPTKTRKVRKRVIFLILASFFIILTIAGINVWKYLSVGIQVVTSDKIELKQTEEKRINILLLGVGGKYHEGADLTDTIIFISLDPKTNKAYLVTIPRDFWISHLDAKINTVYQYGKKNNKDGGLDLAKEIIGDIVGQKIDYAIKINFEGFIRAVDNIGGIVVEVERSFDDYAYPITGLEDDLCGYEEEAIASFSAQIATGSALNWEVFPCRFEHLSFTAGTTYMDGETALKYVRSRHAVGPEGSDFARSKRQERIINAFKEKIFSLGLLLNPVKVFDLINLVKDSIEADINQDEYDDFIRLAQKFKSAELKSYNLDTGDSDISTEGLLFNPPIGEEYNRQWVLVPRAGNGEYGQIHDFIKCALDDQGCVITPSPEISDQHSL